MAHFAFEMLCSIEKCQEQDFRKELLGFGAKAPLISGFTGYTYYASAKGFYGLLITGRNDVARFNE